MELPAASAGWLLYALWAPGTRSRCFWMFFYLLGDKVGAVLHVVSAASAGHASLLGHVQHSLVALASVSHNVLSHSLGWAPCVTAAGA